MDMVLGEVEVRVLGCLIEKSMATPEYYPMTLNSIKAACNQKSNRHPVMALSESQVEDALDVLRYTHRLVCQVTTSGSRVPKYKHDALDRLPVDVEDLALLCELMVRGPQTAGELRTHTRRLCEVESVADVVDRMSALSRLEPDPLVVKLSPGHGHREPRYAHLLAGEVASEVEELDAPVAASATVPGYDERVGALELKLETVQAELLSLREEFATFRKQFE